MRWAKGRTRWAMGNRSNFCRVCLDSNHRREGIAYPSDGQLAVVVAYARTIFPAVFCSHPVPRTQPGQSHVHGVS